MKEYKLSGSSELVLIDLAQVSYVKSHTRTCDDARGPAFGTVKITYATIGITGSLFMVDETYETVKDHLRIARKL